MYNKVFQETIQGHQRQDGEQLKQKTKEMQEWDFKNNRKFEEDFDVILKYIKDKCIHKGLKEIKEVDQYGQRITVIIKEFDYISNCLYTDDRKYKVDFIIIVNAIIMQYKDGREQVFENKHRIGLELKANNTMDTLRYNPMWKWIKETGFKAEPKDTTIIDEKSIRDLLYGIMKREFDMGFVLVEDQFEKDFSYFSMVDTMFTPHAPIDRLQDGSVRGKQLYEKINSQRVLLSDFNDNYTIYLFNAVWEVIKYAFIYSNYDFKKKQCHNPYNREIPIHGEGTKGGVI